jgi:hypothetical protein
MVEVPVVEVIVKAVLKGIITVIIIKRKTTRGLPVFRCDRCRRFTSPKPPESVLILLVLARFTSQ